MLLLLPNIEAADVREPRMSVVVRSNRVGQDLRELCGRPAATTTCMLLLQSTVYFSLVSQCTNLQSWVHVLGLQHQIKYSISEARQNTKYQLHSFSSCIKSNAPETTPATSLVSETASTSANNQLANQTSTTKELNKELTYNSQ